jgi:2',3'-cyclic-nucleotide 2'-phosphodiesterase (5'-nucleotidase family)
VNGKPLDDKQMYTLATTSYVAEDGGDGYTMFKSATQLIPKAQQPFESDILQKAIQSVTVIAPIVEGRIIRVDSAKSQSNCN